MSQPDTQSTAQPHLKKQDLATLDINTLNPLSPEVISRQATINIGTIGHVAHGKSTVVKAISGVQTVRFKNELERNITIKLDKLTETEILDITKSAEALRMYIEMVNETFPESPYLRRQLRVRTKSATAHERLDEFFPPVRRSKRPRDSLCSDDSSSVSSLGSRRSSEVHMPLTKRMKPNKANEYVVESVLSVEHKDSRPLFLVKWLGWEKRHNTWEPLSNLRDTEHLEKFLESELIATGRDCVEEFVRDLIGTLPIPTNPTELIEILTEAEELDELELQANLILLVRIKLFDRERYPKRMLERTRKMAKLRKYRELRFDQLAKMEAWCDDVNLKESLSKIIVENFSDFDIPPENFVYITKNIPGQGVELTQKPAVSCDCPDGCSYYSSQCCSKLKGLPFAYNSKRGLRLQRGYPIFECNSGCKCGPDCINRVVQQGRKNKLILFKTADRGWGVRTMSAIPEGQFICEYTGEIITSDEAEKRGKAYDVAGRTYLFDLDYQSSDNLYTIDALNYGNIARFINHSCEPNCDIYACWGENGDPHQHSIVFFANRRIEADEELSIDYLNGSGQAQTLDASQEENKQENVDPNSPSKEATPRKTPKKGFRMITTPLKEPTTNITKNLLADFTDIQPTPEEHEEPQEVIKFKCLCGAAKCRQWIFN